MTAMKDADIGPVAYGHINFRGTYSFPIDRYATRILRAAA